jgi:hypothetical protein
MAFQNKQKHLNLQIRQHLPNQQRRTMEQRAMQNLTHMQLNEHGNGFLPDQESQELSLSKTKIFIGVLTIKTKTPRKEVCG